MANKRTLNSNKKLYQIFGEVLILSGHNSYFRSSGQTKSEKNLAENEM
jgi:hypothetical protein